MDCNKVVSSEIQKETVDEADGTVEIKEEIKEETKDVGKQETLEKKGGENRGQLQKKNVKKQEEITLKLSKNNSKKVPVDTKEIIETRKEINDDESVSSFESCCDVDGEKIRETDEQDDHEKSASSFETCCDGPMSPEESPILISSRPRSKVKPVKYPLPKSESSPALLNSYTSSLYFSSLDYFTKTSPKKEPLSPINSTDENKTLSINCDVEKNDKVDNNKSKNIVINPFFMANKKRKRCSEDEVVNVTSRKKIKKLVKQNEKIVEKEINEEIFKKDNDEKILEKENNEEKIEEKDIDEKIIQKVNNEEIVEKDKVNLEDLSLKEEEILHEDSKNNLEGTIISETSYESSPPSSPLINLELPSLSSDKASQSLAHEKIPTELSPKHHENNSKINGEKSKKKKRGGLAILLSESSGDYPKPGPSAHQDPPLELPSSAEKASENSLRHPKNTIKNINNNITEFDVDLNHDNQHEISLSSQCSTNLNGTFADVAKKKQYKLSSIAINKIKKCKIFNTSNDENNT